MTMLLLFGGIALSAGATLMLALLVADCLRPRGIEADGRRPAGRRPGRWLWTIMLAGSFLLGLNGLAIWTSQKAGPPREAEGPPALRRERTLRLPFLILIRHDVIAATGDPLDASTTFTLQVPWLFLLGAGLYGRVGRRPPPPAS
jgi:hypothetical protein